MIVRSSFEYVALTGEVRKYELAETEGDGRGPFITSLWMRGRCIWVTYHANEAIALEEYERFKNRRGLAPRQDSRTDGPKRRPPPPAATQRFRHVRRGTVYSVLGPASLQSSAGPLPEGTRLVVYADEDGRLWARSEAEFTDGRFEALPPTPGPLLR